MTYPSILFYFLFSNLECWSRVAYHATFLLLSKLNKLRSSGSCPPKYMIFRWVFAYLFAFYLATCRLNCMAKIRELESLVWRLHPFLSVLVESYNNTLFPSYRTREENTKLVFIQAEGFLSRNDIVYGPLREKLVGKAVLDSRL